MEARALTELVAAVVPRAWRRDSPWHGEAHWRCVTATGLELRSALHRVDPIVVLCFGLLNNATNAYRAQLASTSRQANFLRTAA